MSANFRSVRKILREDWDPIGCGVPQDEYDDYVGPVMRLLVENRPPSDITGYLRVTAAETIACPVSEEKLAAVVEKLMTLRREQ